MVTETAAHRITKDIIKDRILEMIDHNEISTVDLWRAKYRNGNTFNNRNKHDIEDLLTSVEDVDYMATEILKLLI